MDQKIKTDVVIVGAGPTGLSLAAQLIRYGVDFVIVEKNESGTPFSKAIGVQARTLEIYEQLGLAQKAVEQGRLPEKRAWSSGARYAPTRTLGERSIRVGIMSRAERRYQLPGGRNLVLKGDFQGY